MGESAYQLERFAAPAKQQQRPRVRVAERTKRAKASPVARMVRTMVTAVVLVVLIGGVLYTQATITELQGQISTRSKELVEEEALSAYLTYELEGMTNIRNVEQRARELGLAEINKNQQAYVRVEDGEQVEVKENALVTLFNKARTGLLSAADTLEPLPPLSEEEADEMEAETE